MDEKEKIGQELEDNQMDNVGGGGMLEFPGMPVRPDRRPRPMTNVASVGNQFNEITQINSVANTVEDDTTE